MMTPMGPASGGCVIRMTVRRNVASVSEGCATRKTPLAMSCAHAQKGITSHSTAHDSSFTPVCGNEPRKTNHDARRGVTRLCGNRTPCYGGLGLLHRFQNFYVVFHRRHLGEDGNGDFRRRFGADFEADGTAQARDFSCR